MRGTLARIRPDERRETFAATLTVFLVLVAHALLETARDALFLANVPATRLPLVYLALAVLSAALARLFVRGATRLDARRSLLLSHLVAAIGTACLWALTATPSTSVYYGLYVWAGIASMSVLVPLWLHLSERFTPTQAKRLFPVIGAGSIAGVVLGYAMSDAIARGLGTPALLLASAAAFALSASGPLLLGRLSRGEDSDGNVAEPAKPGLWDGVAIAIRHPYARRVALLLLLGSVTVTLVDFVFKSMVAEAVPAADLGPFFARTYFVFNALSLITLLAVAGPGLRRFGVIAVLALLPAALLVGGLGLAFAGGFVAAMVLKGADGAMRWSTHKTATELLYVPMPRQIRSLVKSVVEMAMQRGGQAAGSLVILAVLTLTHDERVFGLLICACAALWSAVVIGSREMYLDLFRETLNEGVVETRLEFPDLDIGSLETLMAALGDANDKKVIAAMELLHQKSKSRLIPSLILYHPSPEVVVHALDLFAETKRTDVLPVVERIVDHEFAEVRAAVLRAMMAVRPDPEVLRHALEHHCPVVNATAMVGLAAGGWQPIDEIVAQLLRGIDEDVELARPMIARAIRYRPLPGFAPVLNRLAQAPDLATRREAVLAMRAARDARFVPSLIPLLRERALREDVRLALRELGPPALDALERALADPSIAFAVRVHVPRTISRFQSERAAEILVRLLLEEPRGMIRYKALRGLGRLVAKEPTLRLDDTTLDEVLERTIASCFRVLHWRSSLELGGEERTERRTPSHDLLMQLLRDKERHSIERLFRTLGVRFRADDLERIYDGLNSSSPRVRSSSRELLGSVLPTRLRSAVLGLIDDDSPRLRLQAGGEYYEADDLDYDRLLAVLASEPSPTLRSIAFYHAAEIGVAGIGDSEGLEGEAEALAHLRRRAAEIRGVREAAARGGPA